MEFGKVIRNKNSLSEKEVVIIIGQSSGKN